jgi:hypothetical protein
MRDDRGSLSRVNVNYDRKNDYNGGPSNGWKTIPYVVIQTQTGDGNIMLFRPNFQL